MAVVLVKATVPADALYSMLPDVRVTVPAIVKVCAAMLNTPEFNANVPVDPTVTEPVEIVNVPDECVYVPFITKLPAAPNETVPALCVKAADGPNVKVKVLMERVLAFNVKVVRT